MQKIMYFSHLVGLFARESLGKDWRREEHKFLPIEQKGEESGAAENYHFL
jgi:hypothetical protein